MTCPQRGDWLCSPEHMAEVLGCKAVWGGGGPLFERQFAKRYPSYGGEGSQKPPLLRYLVIVSTLRRPAPGSRTLQQQVQGHALCSSRPSSSQPQGSSRSRVTHSAAAGPGSGTLQQQALCTALPLKPKTQPPLPTPFLIFQTRVALTTTEKPQRNIRPR